MFALLHFTQPIFSILCHIFVAFLHGLSRADVCAFKEVVNHNRMLFNCYVSLLFSAGAARQLVPMKSGEVLPVIRLCIIRTTRHSASFHKYALPSVITYCLASIIHVCCKTSSLWKWHRLMSYGNPCSCECYIIPLARCNFRARDAYA